MIILRWRRKATPWRLREHTIAFPTSHFLTSPWSRLVETVESKITRGGASVLINSKNCYLFMPIYESIFPQVCPPSLHISLGLWDKFFKLLVRDIQDLGEKIADELAAAEHVNIIDYNTFCNCNK